MASRKIVYGASVAVTTTNLASLASSSTWVAGWESTAIANSTDLVLDRLFGGWIAVGTSPTANTIIEIWLIPRLDDTNWPDVFDGTDSAETVTTRAILLNFGRLGASLAVDTTTTARSYPFWFSAVAALGGPLPSSMGLFITHNTGVALHATAGNHIISHTPVYESIA
jgi:hypothetical protein